MHLIARPSQLIALTLFCISSSGWVFAQGDMVRTVNGEVRVGNITRDDKNGVELSLGSGSLPFKSEEIDSIRYEISVPEYRDAMQAARNNDFLGAAHFLNVLTSDDDAVARFRRKVALPYIFYLTGEYYYRAGKADEAFDAFERFMKKFGDSRYVSLAIGNMVDAAIQTKRWQKVAPLLKDLAALGPRERARALMYEGMVLLANGNNFTAAEQKFNQAAATAIDDQTKALANLGRADCAVAAKDYAKARSMAEQILNGKVSPTVAAKACIVIGDSYMGEVATASGEEAQNKLRDAILAYMRVRVMYSGDRATEPQALFSAGDAFTKLAALSRQSIDRQRGRSLFQTVMENYAGTSWAQKASQIMNR